MRMYYRKPATVWEETLPIGNGHLGAMIHGGVEEELLGLNDDRLWNGTPKADKNRSDAWKNLEELRRLVYEERYTEADRFSENNIQGGESEGYFPFGNLRIKTDHKSVDGYCRELLLDQALARVSYEVDGVTYTREYFASYPAGAILMRFEARRGDEGANVLNLELSFDSVIHAYGQAVEWNGVDAHPVVMRMEGICEPYPEGDSHMVDGCGNDLKLVAAQKERTYFTGAVRMLEFAGAGKPDECIHRAGEQNEILQIRGASCVVFAFSSSVEPAAGMEAVYEQLSFDESRGDTYKIEKQASWESLFAEHLTDYKSIYDRVELHLGEPSDMPTDERLEALKQGMDDPDLYALYFQYGRYLLIASSRPGSNAMNLQGIWSWYLWAPWSSNYTTNINTEMNYWPAENCNLAECVEPYFDLMEKVSVTGQKTAKSMGCRGAAVGHNVDIWGNTMPVGYNSEDAPAGNSRWGMWLMAGGFMCQELWKHFEYSDDMEFLEKRVYPILRQQALFLCDWFYEKDGVYITCPSTSPENVFVTPEGGEAAVSMASTMDLAIARDVFSHFISCCELLKLQDELLPEIGVRLEKMLPYQIGRYGQLQEWYKDFDEVEPGHRHVSHLFGLYPGEEFCADESLVKAARVSLERRLSHGGGYTGWSCAWIINLFAVLGEGEKAYEYLEVLLKRSTYPNLWDAHPPFQIDGNFGGIAGIANMLVQDRGGEVKLLPALPKAWKQGFVKGLRIKHKKQIDLSWENGQLKEYRIYDAE